MSFLAYQLHPEEYPAVREWMLTEASYQSPSFKQQMVAMASRKPDAFLLTAYSAVPIADSIRGFYDTIGESVPTLHYVHANTANSRDRDRRKAMVVQEVLRLKPLLALVETVCVVNQYHCTGGSLLMGVAIANDIGVPTIKVIEGQWYHDVDNDDVDLDNMSSTHAELMYEIGTCVGKAALATPIG